jgi:hypothetical protein
VFFRVLSAMLFHLLFTFSVLGFEPCVGKSGCFLLRYDVLGSLPLQRSMAFNDWEGIWSSRHGVDR